MLTPNNTQLKFKNSQRARLEVLKKVQKYYDHYYHRDFEEIPCLEWSI